MKLRNKLSSTNLAKNMLIASVVILAICGAISLIVSLQLFDLPGLCFDRTKCDRNSLIAARNFSNTLVQISRASIAVMILSGIVLGLSGQKNRKKTSGS